MARETGKTRLTVDAWEDMERELLWSFDDDVFAGRIPADHVVVLWSLEKTVGWMDGNGREKRKSGMGRHVSEVTMSDGGICTHA